MHSIQQKTLTGAGLGMRAAHQGLFQQGLVGVPWIEVHSENYFATGAPAQDLLLEARKHYALSLHGVGLNLGSVDALDTQHLKLLRQLVRRTQPALVSEHLSWGAIHGKHLNDLLPLPFTREAVAHLVPRIQHVQEFLGRRILLENISSYFEFKGAEMTEWEFVSEVVKGSGCGLLLDVNNVFVSATNHGFDPYEYLNAIPATMVEEIHLAGHSLREFQGASIRVDTHNAPVCAEVWTLYAYCTKRFGAIPTLIEWDTDLPGIDVLLAEAHHANGLMEVRHDLAA